MNWFLYDTVLRHERVRGLILDAKFGGEPEVLKWNFVSSGNTKKKINSHSDLSEDDMLANINQVLEFLSNNNIRVHHINPKGSFYIYHAARMEYSF